MARRVHGKRSRCWRGEPSGSGSSQKVGTLKPYKFVSAAGQNAQANGFIAARVADDSRSLTAEVPRSVGGKEISGIRVEVQPVKIPVSGCTNPGLQGGRP